MAAPMPALPEIPLAGGRLSHGIVRVGNTARRLVARAYGLAVAERARLIDALRGRQARNESFWREQLRLAAVTLTSPEQMRELVL